MMFEVLAPLFSDRGDHSMCSTSTKNDRECSLLDCTKGACEGGDDSDDVDDGDDVNVVI